MKTSKERLHAFSIFKPIEKNEKNYPLIKYFVNPLGILGLQQPDNGTTAAKQ